MTKISTTQAAILRHLSKSDRDPRYFMGLFGDAASTEYALSSMSDSGLIDRRENGKSKFFITDEGLQALQAANEWVTTPRHVNSSMKDTYIPVKWQSARPGADQFLAVESRGVGAT